MVDLKDHQREAIAHLLEWRVGALFMEAGTGKTRVACELVSAASDIDMVLWVGPLRTLKGGAGIVPDEVEKWMTTDVPVMYFGVESIGGSDRIYMEAMNAMEGRRCFMVVDESLKIKNPNAKRTQRVIELGKRAEYKLILNGTPLSRNLLDLWSQMEFLSPRILGMTFARFKDTFCDYVRETRRHNCRTYVKEYIRGYENIDYLYSLIRHYVYQCDLRLNVSQQFSEWRYHVDEEARADYDSILDYYLTEDLLEWRNNNIFMEMTNKMQHCYCVTEDKFRAVDDIIDYTGEPDRTIIFCRYVKSREACESRYPRCRVLSYQKESLGLNLQQYCHTVYFDKTWDYALMAQSGHRTYRVGQERDCRYYDLTGDVGLERMISRNISRKVGMTEYFKRATKEQIINDLK